MDKKLASRLVRLNRKIAWFLVLSSLVLIITGYGQSIKTFDRLLMRDLHLISEWAFIALLSYHVVVGTFLARYRYISTVKRILDRKAGIGVIMRFVLRLTSWPLLVLSVLIIVSGLSWYGILIVSFNQHIEIDALFFIIFAIHTMVGSGVALKRLRTRLKKEYTETGIGGDENASRRKFVRNLGGIGALIIAAIAGYSIFRLRRSPDPGNFTGNGTEPPVDVPPTPDDFPHRGTVPVAQGKVVIAGNGYTFNPRRVETIRPDIFRSGFFSVFDVLVHLHREGKITLEYHFDDSMNTNVIDRIDGEPNWWYQIYFSGGWPENNVFRADHYPWKDGTTLRISRMDPARIEAIYQTWRDEVERLQATGGKVIIPNVLIGSRSFRREFRNVEVKAHNMRKDIFQEGVITALDVIMSLGDQKKLSYDLKWYEAIGNADIVKDYWIEKIDSDKAFGGCGYVYEAGSLKYRRFTGNHIHLPTGSRPLNSPEYVELFWICL